jgi:predicted acetyltransferase
MSEKLELVKLTNEMKAMYEEMVRDYRDYGEDRRWGDNDTFENFVARLQENELGVNVSPGYVSSSTYWLMRNGRTLLGRSSLRHCLTPTLEIEGGHIGYSIRPSQRRRGYGTMILALSLAKARERGIRRILVTCDTNNMASTKIILKNGGVFENEIVSPHSGKSISRYWITLLYPGDTILNSLSPKP